MWYSLHLPLLFLLYLHITCTIIYLTQFSKVTYFWTLIFKRNIVSVVNRKPIVTFTNLKSSLKWMWWKQNMSANPLPMKISEPMACGLIIPKGDYIFLRGVKFIKLIRRKKESWKVYSFSFSQGNLAVCPLRYGMDMHPTWGGNPVLDSPGWPEVCELRSNKIRLSCRGLTQDWKRRPKKELELCRGWVRVPVWPQCNRMKKEDLRRI